MKVRSKAKLWMGIFSLLAVLMILGIHEYAALIAPDELRGGEAILRDTGEQRTVKLEDLIKEMGLS